MKTYRNSVLDRIRRQSLLLPFLAVSLLFLASCGSSSEEAPLRVQQQQKGSEATHVKWTLLSESVTATPGEQVDLKLKAEIAPGVRLYSAKQYDGLEFRPVALNIATGPAEYIASQGSVFADATPTSSVDPHFGGEALEYWEGTIVISIPVVIAEAPPKGKGAASISVEYMTCTDRACHPPATVTFPVELAIVQ